MNNINIEITWDMDYAFRTPPIVMVTAHFKRGIPEAFETLQSLDLGMVRLCDITPAENESMYGALNRVFTNVYFKLALETDGCEKISIVVQP
jgi:hypothetical protein